MKNQRSHRSADEVRTAYDRLALAGFTPQQVGRPRKGSKPMAPALADALDISERRARQLIARRLLPPGTTVVPSARTSAVVRAARNQFQQALGTKVDLRDEGGVGTVVVHYSGYAQLEELMRKMGAL